MQTSRRHEEKDLVQKMGNINNILLCHCVSFGEKAIVEFVLAQWKLPEHATRLLHSSLYVCHGNQSGLLRSPGGCALISGGAHRFARRS